jgi:hypothetical protein
MNSVLCDWSETTNVTLKWTYSSGEMNDFGIVFDSLSYIHSK